MAGLRRDGNRQQAPAQNEPAKKSIRNVFSFGRSAAVRQRNQAQSETVLRKPSVAFTQSKEKSGTKGSIEAVQGLMDADASTRAKKVHEILTKYDASADSLQRLSLWLMGPPIPATEYQRVAGTDLVADIQTRFGVATLATRKGPPRALYLLDLAANGHPSPYSKLLTSLGQITGGGAHPTEVLRIIEAEKPGPEILRELWPAIRLSGLSSAERQRIIAATRMHRAETREANAADNKKGARHGETLEAKVAHLASMVSSGEGRRSFDRKRVFEEVAAWAKAQPLDVRRAAVAPGSEFLKVMESSKWKSGDRNYVIALVRPHQALPEHLIEKDDDGDHEGGDDDAPQGDDVTKEDASTAKVHEARAYIDRKIEKNYRTKDHKYGKLKARIEAMSDEEREGFLLTYLKPDQQRMFGDPQVSPEVLEPLRQQALEALRAELKQMSFKDKDKLLARFAATAARGKLDKGSVYKQLAKMKKGPHLNKTIMHLLGRANGTDYYNIRNDKKLLAFLDKKLDDKEKAKMHTLLGLEQGEAVDLEGTWSTRDTKLKQSSEQAELSPAHWQVRLGQALTDNSPTTAFQVVTGAYYAAKRRATAQGMAPLDVHAFMQGLIEGMSPKKLAKLKDKRFRPAFEAIERGTTVDVDDRLNAATFNGARRIRRLGGNDAKEKSVRAIFDELSGVELLEEWSNIETLRRLTRRKQRLQRRRDDEGLQEVNVRIRDFILDIRSDRRRWMRNHFTQSVFVEVLEGARTKLQKAAANDDAFKARLGNEEYTNDKYAQQRMQGLGALDRQRQDDSGLQVGMQWRGTKFSRVRSHERREARSDLVGGFRTAQQDLRDVEGEGQDEQTEARQQVNEQRTPEIGGKLEELERRTEKFRSARARALTAAKIAISIIVAIIMAAATAGFAAIPMATATALWVPVLVKIGMVTTTSILKQLVFKALEGDAFNGRKAVVDVAMAVGTSALGGMSHMASAHVLHDLGLDGASNLLADNPHLAQTIGQYFEAAAIESSLDVAITKVLPTALEIASKEDPAATSKAMQFLPLVTSWVGSFALDTAKNLAIDASQQAHGLYQIKQENEWGGVNHDAAGKAIKLDRFGNENPAPLNAGQKLAKLGITQGIGLPLGPVGDKLLDKGVEKMEDALTNQPETKEMAIPKGRTRDQQPEDPQARQTATRRVERLLSETLQRARYARGRAEACDRVAGEKGKKASGAKQLAAKIRAASGRFDVQWKSTYELLIRSKQNAQAVPVHDLEISREMLETEADAMRNIAFQAASYE